MRKSSILANWFRYGRNGEEYSMDKKEAGIFVGKKHAVFSARESEIRALIRKRAADNRLSIYKEYSLV